MSTSNLIGIYNYTRDRIGVSYGGIVSYIETSNSGGFTPDKTIVLSKTETSPGSVTESISLDLTKFDYDSYKIIMIVENCDQVLSFYANSMLSTFNLGTLTETQIYELPLPPADDSHKILYCSFSPVFFVKAEVQNGDSVVLSSTSPANLVVDSSPIATSNKICFTMPSQDTVSSYIKKYTDSLTNSSLTSSSSSSVSIITIVLLIIAVIAVIAAVILGYKAFKK